MIRYSKDMATDVRKNMRGGDGEIRIKNLFEEHIPHMRMLAEVTLEPGCSLGEHPHENEAEAYYVLEGEASLLDNGTPVTLHAGDAHLCRSGEQHALANRSDKTLRVLAIIPTMAE